MESRFFNLIQLAGRCNIESLLQEIQLPDDLRRQDAISGATLLHVIVANNNSELFHWIITQEFVDVSICDSHGQNPIDLAKQMGRYDWAEIMLNLRPTYQLAPDPHC